MECAKWVERVQAAQSRRTPEEWEAARARCEQARQTTASYRKCKAVKGHSIRSRALAVEGLRQMSEVASPQDHMAVQARWKSAQAVSRSRQETQYAKCSKALSTLPEGNAAAAEVFSDADEEEEQAMVEVAGLVGAQNVQDMVSAGTEGLPSVAAVPVQPVGGHRGRASSGGGGAVEGLLAQLRKEPANEEECAAKFQLYEGYASEVEEMRGTLLRFHEETRPTVPEPVAKDMDKHVHGIDSQEAMGIPDNHRDWFVWHMMRQAERNNQKMAGILEGFEKKLEFLAANDQKECPICLDDFTPAGPHAAETLGCCHKVCRDCWDSWTAVTNNRPFCPLCRHDAFLGVVAQASSAPGAPVGGAESDSD
uniref:RING-type domain-containing protein n=1 Tax=Alexandrium monilatum TaxID=311494 RepID=A0A7S4QIE7_9DINO